MKNNIFSIMMIAGMVALGTNACNRDDDKREDVTVISKNGDITSGVNEFRQLLGNPLNTTPGAVGGRREINWDGVPDSLMNKPLPFRFFNPEGTDPALAPRQRGLTYAPTPAPGGGGTFMVSNNNFSPINDKAAGEFAAFSGNKTFSNTTSLVWEIDPEPPGIAAPGTVKGFGIVFSDVDKDSSTFLEFFNETKSLGKFFVPKHDNTTSFSFLGVYFKKEKVTSIRVGHEGFLSANEQDISQGGTKDLVVLDDFLYDEPVRK
jgi:hypothetical protein